MEEWLGARAGDSPCCEVCGDRPCRTMEVDGQTYEAIPEDLIVKAAILAEHDRLAAESLLEHRHTGSAVAREFKRQATPRTIGMVLMKHGVFSFGDTARESYERMIDLVDRAERYLAAQRAWRSAKMSASGGMGCVGSRKAGRFQVIVGGKGLVSMQRAR